MHDEEWMRRLQSLADGPAIGNGRSAAVLSPSRGLPSPPATEPTASEQPEQVAQAEARIAAITRAVDRLASLLAASVEGSAESMSARLAAVESAVAQAAANGATVRHITGVSDLVHRQGSRFDELERLVERFDPAPGLTEVGNALEERLRSVEAALDAVLRLQEELVRVANATAEHVAELRASEDRRDRAGSALGRFGTHRRGRG